MAVEFHDPHAARRRQGTECVADADLHWRGDRLVCTRVTTTPEQRLRAADALLTRLQQSSR
jgi:hypothetical protein